MKQFRLKELTNDEFKPFIVDEWLIPINAEHLIFRFPNDLGVSVIRNESSMGIEAMTVLFPSKIANGYERNGSVVGELTRESLNRLLAEIKEELS